jgi:hypothetical protein
LWCGPSYCIAVHHNSDEAAYINGACVTVDGGRWLQGAGTFSSLSRLSEAEWHEMRARRSS